MRNFSTIAALFVLTGAADVFGQLLPADNVAHDGNMRVGTAPPVETEPRVWASADYLMWWIKPVCLKPPTIAVADGTGTTVIQGGHKFEFNGLSGFRPTFGIWLTPDRTIGVEASGFLLEQGRATQTFNSANGSPLSFITSTSPQNTPQRLPFSIPSVVNGDSAAVGQSWLWGTEANLTLGFSATQGGVSLNADVLFGFRYLDLRDKVDIANTLSRAGDPSSFATGAVNFTTHNQFYGGQIGLRCGLECGNWSLSYSNKIALGETHQTREITGSPLLAASGNAGGLLPGPVLALPSNVGREFSNRITVVPEAAFRVRYRWTDRISTSVGYSALYWNKVLCPGDQMDDHLNTTQLPGRGPVSGPLNPSPLFVQTDFFAQGYDVGIEFRY